MALVAAAAALVCRAWRSSSPGTKAPLPGGVARRGRAAALLLLVPPLHGGTVGPRGRRVARPAARGAGRRGATLAALCAAALPWLHVKMIPAAAALGLVALVRLRGRALADVPGRGGTLAVSFGLYYASVFGLASPLALYGGVPADAQVLSWRSLPGLFLDRSFGMLEVAPVFLLALAGLPIVLRRREAWPHALVGLAVLAPLLSWRMWWGGQCPPARFLVPMLPFLVSRWHCGSRTPRRASPAGARACSSTGAVLSVVAVAEPLLDFC